MKKFTVKGYKDLYKNSVFTFNPGVTILIGKNGAGKTTLLNTLRDMLKKEGIPTYKFNNYSEGGSRAAERYGFLGQTENLMAVMSSSEGEQILFNIGEEAGKIGAFVTNSINKKDSTIFILLDAVDSGLSINNIVEIKENLFNTIVEDCSNRGIDVYIVASANTFELARDCDCINVATAAHKKFKTYETYKKFICSNKDTI